VTNGLSGLAIDLGGTLFAAVSKTALEGMRAEGMAEVARSLRVPDENEFVSVLDRRLAERHERAKRIRREFSVEGGVLEACDTIGVERPDKTRLVSACEAFYSPYVRDLRIADGAVASLAWALVRGFRLALVSNGAWKRFTDRLLRENGLSDVFDPVVVSEDVGMRKPDPRIFEVVVSSWDVNAGAIVMIGDDPCVDIEGAKAAGLRTIWFRNGRHESACADATIDSWHDLPWVLSGWVGES
jgi:FMN phosphatase YigB (HAD superfamily)